MAHTSFDGIEAADILTRSSRRVYLIVALFASAIYFGCAVSPPSLMDDVDAAVARVAENMVRSGDWVTPRADGIAFLEKPAMFYWPIAVSFKLFGFHDWAARIPFALAAVGLSCLACGFGIWAFGRAAGLYAGLCISTCTGLFLFTRIVIPDVTLTLTIGLALWALVRALDDQEKNPRFWAYVLGASLGTGMLIKSLVGVAFPVAIGGIYLLLTGQLFTGRTWQKLRPFGGALIALAIAVPWHLLATIRNPPYFSLATRGGPGEYHGFLWFYLVNEQVLRFLNLRYPRDYNTVPRVWFWLFHFLWLFPWSVYFPAIGRLSFQPVDREGKTRLLALCWIGFVLVFFTFSTTQEYYSMPCYTALALLLGSAMASGGVRIRLGTRVLGGVTALCAVAAAGICYGVRNLPTPGDISGALGSHPSAYTLSLGHMEDLTFESFAYLRLPLLVAGTAFLIGAAGTLRGPKRRAFLSTALMMVLFFHAARLALVVFDPFLTSRPLAEKLLALPPGQLVIDRNYWAFSSLFFYMDQEPLMLNARYFNLEYASYAPGAAEVFLDDKKFQDLWKSDRRCYLVTYPNRLERLEGLVGKESFYRAALSGGKVAVTNHELDKNR